MDRATSITCVFLDIGGVLLTDGWDHHASDNPPMFVQIAEGLGIRSILHTDYKSTCAKLASFGLQNEAGVIDENR